MLASAALVLGFAAASSAGAACDPGAALAPSAETTRVAIESRVSLLSDPQRAFSLADVLGPVACGRFETPRDPAQLEMPGGTRHWLRFRADLGAARSHHWLLYLPIANFERACAYMPTRSGGYATRCIGLAEPQPAGALRHNRMLFEVPDDLDPERPLFLMLDSRAPQGLHGALVTSEAFFSQDVPAQFLGGLFNGLLFATALYNLIFFLAVRDRASLYFAVHLAGLGLAMIGFEGRGREYLWPWLGSWGASVPTAMLAIAFLFGCLGGRDFLLTRERAPRLDLVLRLAAIPSIVSFPVCFVSIGLAEQLTALAGMGYVLALVSAAAVLAGRGDRPARYLLVGLSVFLAGLLAVSLRTLGLSAIPEGMGVPLTRTGLVVASVAISAGLGRRVIDLRRERDRAAAEVGELAETLRRREQMAAMGALVAGVAHEVRNPLFGISSTVDALEARVRSEGVTTHLETLRSQVGRLGKLMNDLLEYGRPQALELGPEDVASVIDEASRACDYLARGSGARIETRVNGPLPPVFLDRKRLVQVFQNLLENALRHSPPGGTVLVELEPAAFDGRRLARVSVRDHGSGFATADLPHVFEPFFTRRRGGTGLGLSIVQQIVEQHSGRVEAQNDPEGGARVVVWLPLGPPA
jgi:signal transduction histidine kinase